jgi:hypothetical protein
MKDTKFSLIARLVIKIGIHLLKRLLLVRHHMRIALAALAIATLPACARDNHVLQERIAYWRDTMSQGVPHGSSKETALAWAKEHNVKFDYYEQQHWLYANVEQVPVSGIPFPCSQWNIILTVSFDATGHSVNNEVSTVGSCL